MQLIIEFYWFILNICVFYTAADDINSIFNIFFTPLASHFCFDDLKMKFSKTKTNEIC